MTESTIERDTQADPHDGGKKVPVAESIKYRRRAQQAESRIEELEQKLTDLQTQFEARGEELATAEAQRDETAVQLTVAENRMAAQRLLAEAGAVDIEAATLLLDRRMDFSEPLRGESLAQSVEQLLVDKPFLCRPAGATMPPMTSPPRDSAETPGAQMTRAARRALQSGNRRDIAEYLRLRRRMSDPL
jgi:hypothetical protein